MTTATDRKVSLGRSRPAPARLQDLASTPETPRTPLLRSTSSIYGSPGGGFRSEEEYIVLELGSRFLRGGFPGESAPRCMLSFGPNEQRRVGDYRQWDPEYSNTCRKRKRGQEWGAEYELYRMDLRDLDLGLVEDKFERAMREACNKYFLLDPKPRRVLLALPPLMPRPLLSTVLTVLFGNFQAPSITLLSSPVLSTVAAGLRSALVVDIGWAETIVTGIFEYREVHQRRSVRAGKLLSEEMSKMLNVELAKNNPQTSTTSQQEVSFEEAEEVLTRVGWCEPHANTRQTTISTRASSNDEFADASEEPSDPEISIPFPAANPPTTLALPFSSLASPAETALFASNIPLHDLDDHDQPLHLLTYRALLSLPIDVRRVCMSRIIITGGVANLPGLKSRLLAELAALVQQRGWDAVKSYGSATERHEQALRQGQQGQQFRASDAAKVSESTDRSAAAAASVPAGLVDPEPDPITLKLASQAARAAPPAAAVGGVVRGVESLGAWAGASLVAQLRIRGIVEIEREKFLQHGLQGASREKEVSVVPQRQNVGPGMKAGDRGSWTLGVWA